MADIQSEIDAVNEMLSVIGQAPVDSLGSGVNVLAQTSENILNKTALEVLAEPYFFNTEYEVTFSPNSSDEIPLGSNILHADSDVASTNYVKRGTKLYNLTDHTYTFTGDVSLTIIYRLPWDELPEQAKNFIIAKAARKLAERFDRDAVVVRAAKEEEVRTDMMLKAFDSEQADANPLRDNAELAAANNYGGQSIIERGI